MVILLLSPLSRFIPLINGLFMAYKWGLLTTYIHWDDPPSIPVSPQRFMNSMVQLLILCRRQSRHGVGPVQRGFGR